MDALTSFLARAEDAQEDARYLGESATKTWDAQLRYGGPWKVPVPVKRSDEPNFLRQPTAENLVQVRGDAELMGFARLTQFHAWIYAGEVQAILAQVDSVLALVEAGLRGRDPPAATP